MTDLRKSLVAAVQVVVAGLGLFVAIVGLGVVFNVWTVTPRIAMGDGLVALGLALVLVITKANRR